MTNHIRTILFHLQFLYVSRFTYQAWMSLDECYHEKEKNSVKLYAIDTIMRNTSKFFTPPFLKMKFRLDSWLKKRQRRKIFFYKFHLCFYCSESLHIRLSRWCQEHYWHPMPNSGVMVLQYCSRAINHILIEWCRLNRHTFLATQNDELIKEPQTNSSIYLQ